MTGGRWCLITNGIEWAVFDAAADAPLAAKEVTRVRLDGDAAATETAWRVLRLFARQAIARPSPLATLLIERVVQDELTNPSSPTVKTLRKAIQGRFRERVPGDAVVQVVEALLHPQALGDGGLSTQADPPPGGRAKKTPPKTRPTDANAITVPPGLGPEQTIPEALVALAKVNEGRIVVHAAARALRRAGFFASAKDPDHQATGSVAAALTKLARDPDATFEHVARGIYRLRQR